MIKSVSGTFLFILFVLVASLSFSTPVQAGCGCCGHGQAGHSGHSGNATHHNYNCGWCDTHSDHHCVMSDDSWDVFRSNFICPEAAADSNHRCDDHCWSHYLTDAISTCPSNNDHHYGCNNDCLISHLIEARYFDESVREMDGFAFCYDCVYDVAAVHSETCATDCCHHVDDSCCCNHHH